MADIYNKITERAIERFVNHAYEGHVDPQTARYGANEFIDERWGRNLNIHKEGELGELAFDLLKDPETRGFMNNLEGSHAYFYNARENVLIAIEPKQGGTMFRSLDVDSTHFNRLLKNAQNTLGNDIVHAPSGGIDALRNAYIEHFGRNPQMLPLHEAARAFKTVAFETGEALSQKVGLKLFAELAPRIGGRALKFIPLAGTAATFMIGRAEAAELREAAHDAVAEGLLPAEALEDYEKVLFAHQVQVNLDFSMVGMEDDVQEGFDKFADFYELDDETRERLEPPSLIEDVSGMKLDDNSVVFAGLNQPPTAAP